MSNKKVFFVFNFFLLLCTITYAQKSVTGIVLDSTTLSPLPNVTVKIKSSATGTISDEFGYFTIRATLFDTLVVSSVGYITVNFAVKKLDEHLVIHLPEGSHMLKPITVYDHIELRGVHRLPKQSKWANPTNAPLYGTIQTFGPGYTIRGPFSHFSKSEKEKRKLKGLRVDNVKARTYIEIVNSSEVKDSLMNKYSLTEEAYYEILAKFNNANPRSMSLDFKSLTYALFHFFEMDRKKFNASEKK